MKISIKSKVSYKDLALISGNIAKLYDENINLLKILELLEELPLRKDYKEVLKLVGEVIKRGGSIAKSFSVDDKLFPMFFTAIIDIGENAGEVSKVFNGLKKFYENGYFIKTKIKNALAYPMVLVGALLLLFVFIIVFFVPSMANVYNEMGSGIPKIYSTINKISSFFIDSPFIAVIFIMFWGGLLPYVLWKNYLNNYIKDILFKVPICKLFNEYLAISLLNLIINSGMNISVGIDECCKCNVLTSVSKDRMIIMNESIIRGETIAHAMEKSKLFSKYTLAHIKLGEESGAIDKRLVLLEKELSLKLSNNIDNLLKLIEPAVIVIMAMAVVSFLYVFILPLFNNIFIV